MLFRSGKNWAFDLFVRRGWLVKRRRLRRREANWNRPAIVAAECQRLEERILLSTITVTSLADPAGAHSGVTLRDAIQAANTGQAGVQNVIVFQAGLNGTIALANGQFTISSSMIIQGLGAANTIINAQQNSRIFYVANAVGNVTLDGLTLENGKTTADG